MTQPGGSLAKKEISLGQPLLSQIIDPNKTGNPKKGAAWVSYSGSHHKNEEGMLI